MNKTEFNKDSQKWIEVGLATPGYHHTVYEGICGKDVTVEDIKKKFYHTHFGGRDAYVNNGRWRAVCHND